MRRALIASWLAMAVPSCTVISGATGGGIAAYRNHDAPEEEQVSTVGYVFVGMLIGAVVDTTLVLLLKRQWSKPMT